MKILFIHTRGYHSSGPETYLQNMAEIFDKENISYDLFCLDYEKNDFGYVLPNMPKPIGSASIYRYSDQKLSLYNKLRVLCGSVFRLDVFLKLNSVLRKEKYDRVIILQYFLKLSPAIFLAAKKNSVGMVFRQSDFGLICAKNTLYRDGAICKQCTQNQLSMVYNKCGGGFIYSLCLYLIYKVNYLFLIYANPKITWTNQNSFYIGSNSKVLRGLRQYLNYTPVGINGSNFIKSNKTYDFGYIGRISFDKGVDIFLKQLLRRAKLEFKVIFVGSVEEDLNELVEAVKVKHQKQITFIKKVPKKSVGSYMNKCRYLVFTSNWFDNLPNSLIEAYSRGIPCILPNFGCFREFVPSKFPSLAYCKEKDIPLDDFVGIKKLEYSQMSKSVKSICDTKFSNAQHLRFFFDEASGN